MYTPEPRYARFNGIIPCEEGRDGAEMLRHWGLHQTPESAVVCTPGQLKSNSQVNDTLDSDEVTPIDQLQLHVALEEVNRVLTEHTYESLHERRRQDIEQMNRFEEVYEVAEQVGLPIDMGRLLRCAISNDALSVARFLLRRDGNCGNWRDILGRSPLMYAATLPSKEMLELLAARLSMEESRIAMSLQDVFGNTVLHHAVSSSSDPEELLECAIMRQAEPNIRNNKGCSVWKMNDWPQVPNKIVLFKLAVMFCSPDLSHFPIYLVNLPEPVEKNTTRKVLYSDFLRSEVTASVAKSEYSDDNLITPWMHIPWTNGYLIYSCFRTLLDKLYGEDKSKHIDKRNGFWRTMWDGGPGTEAGDLDLTSMVPSYNNKHSVWQSEPDVIFIVFPCLVLQDTSSFNRTRRKFREYKSGLRMVGLGDFIQIERTPDESHYHAASRTLLETRNEQQVVTRECKQTSSGESLAEGDRPILMVPQFWIWKFADLVVSAHSPLGKDSNFEKLLAPKDSQARDTFDLDNQSTTWSIQDIGPDRHVANLLDDRVRRFGEVQGSLKYPSPLDVFEIGVVRVLADVGKYMKNKNLTEDNSDTELDLVNDIADIREELAMIDEILGQQDVILNKCLEDMEAKSIRVSEEQAADAIRRVEMLERRKQKRIDRGTSSRKIEEEERGDEEWEIAKRNKEEKITSEIAETIQVLNGSIDLLHQYRERVQKIDKDAERIDKTVHDRLNLKRAFASIQDARTSMKDARTSLLLALAVIGFTVITIVFAPLAFMTALFALPIDELVRHKSGTGDDAVFPSWYILVTFGAAEIVTIGLTVTLVWVCLRNQDTFSEWIRQYSEKHKKQGKEGGPKAAKKAEDTATEKATDAKSKDEISSSSSSLRRRRGVRSAAGLDAEERGEQQATD